jgi:hypothetical protein
MQCSKRRNGGYVLLEATMSIAIIGVGLTAILDGMSACTRMEARHRERGVAVRLAEAQMLMLPALTQMREGDYEGKYEPPYDLYLWKANIMAGDRKEPFSLVTVSIFKKDAASPAYVFKTFAAREP